VQTTLCNALLAMQQTYQQTLAVGTASSSSTVLNCGLRVGGKESPRSFLQFSNLSGISQSGAASKTEVLPEHAPAATCMEIEELPCPLLVLY